METITFSPGAWDELSPKLETFATNTNTYFDELWDRDELIADLSLLSHFNEPTLCLEAARMPHF